MSIDFLKRKEKIIITAIDLLDEVGINGLTMKEIGKRQNITEPSVYRQFSSKQEIVNTIIDRYSAYDKVVKNTILDNNMSGKEGILYWVKAYSEYYGNYPQITTVMFSFDIFKYDNEANEKMSNVVNERYDLLQQLVKRAIEHDEISKDKDIQAVTDGIFGVIYTTTFLWRMAGCSFDLKERLTKAVENIINN